MSSPPGPHVDLTADMGPENRNELEGLFRFLELAEGFDLFILNVQSSPLLAAILAAVRSFCRDRRFVEVDLAKSERPEAVTVSLLEAAKGRGEATPAVYFLHGFDAALGERGERPLALQVLNEQRDLIASQLRAPLLIALRPEQLAEFRIHAPDFWSIRTSLFSFSAVMPPPVVPPAQGEYEWLDDPEKYLQQIARLSAIRRGAPVRLLVAAYRALIRLVPGLEDVLELEARLGIERSSLLPRLYWKLGRVYTARSEWPKADQAFGKGLKLARAIGDVQCEADLFQARGQLQARRYDWELARSDYERALGLFRAVDDRHGEANTLRAQGDVLQFQDQYAAAMERYEAALALFRAVGDRLGEANVHQSIGLLLEAEDSPGAAWERFENALQGFREIGDRYSEIVTLLYAGRMWRRFRDASPNAREREKDVLGRGLELARALSNERLIQDFEEALRSEAK